MRGEAKAWNALVTARPRRERADAVDAPARRRPLFAHRLIPQTPTPVRGRLSGVAGASRSRALALICMLAAACGGAFAPAASARPKGTATASASFSCSAVTFTFAGYPDADGN